MKELVQFCEKITNKILNKSQREWILHQFSKFQEILEQTEPKKNFKFLLKLLNQQQLLFKQEIINISDLKNEKTFQHNSGILLGTLLKKEKSSIHLGSLFLHQSEKNEIVCEILNPKMEHISEICFIQDWNYIHCSSKLPKDSPPSEEFSYLEIAQLSSIRPIPTSIPSFELGIGGFIESISPFFIQKEKLVSFYLEIMDEERIFILFSPIHLTWRNFLKIGGHIMLRNLKELESKDSHRLFITTSETSVEMDNGREGRTNKENSSLINYEGKITSILGDGVYGMDDEFLLFLTHYSLKNYGRGLRIGNTLRLSNVHPVLVDQKWIGFGACLYSDVNVIQFSESPSIYHPLIHKYSIFYSIFQEYSIVESYFMLENYKLLESHFELSHKRILKILIKLMKKKEKRIRNVSNEFIHHSSCCEMVKNDFKRLNLFDWKFQSSTLRSEDNYLIIGRVSFDLKKNLFHLHSSIHSIPFLVLSPGNGTSLQYLKSNQMIQIHYCHLINHILIIESMDNIEILEDIVEFDKHVSKQRFPLENIQITFLVKNEKEIIVECKHSIILKFKTLELFHFLQIGSSYRIYGMKREENKRINIYVEENEIRIERIENNDPGTINDVSYVLNVKKNEIISFHGMLIQKMDSKIKVRDIQSSVSLDVYFNGNVPVEWTEGSIIQFHRVSKKVSKSENVYCTIESFSLFSIEQFEFKMKTFQELK
jgi:hypothetical protein